jgi:UDP-N-acetylglucosamine--N-acetylmuramyl-(pentapeptide) pyrophosphoryl-undecaprenol N-acetylglucosamine transferase
MSASHRFVIAAGGTGGHLFPGLAVGEVLRARGHEVMILISEKEIDRLATEGRTEFRIERLPGIGLPRLFSLAALTFAQRFMSGINRCRRLFEEYQPAAVLGMGGFTSTAPILAGGLRKVPTFVHESNAIPGKANRLNGRLVSTVLLGFEECRRFFPKARCEVTGTPIRQTLLDGPLRPEALAKFGLDRLRKTMLVMGGSQGATGINDAVLSVLPQLAGSGLQVIHLTGPGADEAVRAAYEKAGVPAHVAPFCHDMGSAYRAADFAIARSGAASLAELAQAGLPSVLIPYPFAAENHQFHNAEIFSKRGAAILISQSNLSADSLMKALRWFLDDPQAIPTMSAAATKLAPSQAAEHVADAMLSQLAA